MSLSKEGEASLTLYGQQMGWYHYIVRLDDVTTKI